MTLRPACQHTRRGRIKCSVAGSNPEEPRVQPRRLRPRHAPCAELRVASLPGGVHLLPGRSEGPDQRDEYSLGSWKQPPYARKRDHRADRDRKPYGNLIVSSERHEEWRDEVPDHDERGPSRTVIRPYAAEVEMARRAFRHRREIARQKRTCAATRASPRKSAAHRVEYGNRRKGFGLHDGSISALP